MLCCRFDTHIGPVTGLRNFQRMLVRCSGGADAATGCSDPPVKRPAAQTLKVQQKSECWEGGRYWVEVVERTFLALALVGVQAADKYTKVFLGVTVGMESSGKAIVIWAELYRVLGLMMVGVVVVG